MEIKRIGENKVRCALTEDEIRELGFDIDEIIGNSETTQQFMRVVLGLVEEQEHINIEDISPMVKAELLQNHSMAITFGADSELSFKELVDTMSHIVSQLEPKRLEELTAEARREKQGNQEKQQKQRAGSAKHIAEAMICALRFDTLENMRHMSRVCFPGKVPKSSLYKMQKKYYLILDFTGFTKDEMRPFAFGTVEYDNGHYSDTAQIAHIMEQGTCIMKNNALEMLMQL
ncbi:MAG: adaptor protein MecA [Roseburia sp.]|nr:adaptor protein MecA [Roseburia sp.]